MVRRSDHPQYEILEECGSGGMGVVFRARDRHLNRLVALKFLNIGGAGEADSLARFQREAQAIAALNHPHVATIFEAGEWNGEPFLALEYLSGGTLKGKIPAGGMRVAQLFDYARQLGLGLQFAHSQGILHRDVKPSNCMVSAHGSLKLVDFGLAKPLDGEEITQPGSTVGTLAYMAPELLLGEPATVASDLYAMGAVVYEMAAGRPLFGRDSKLQLIQRILQGDVPALQELRPDLPAHLCNAVTRATAVRSGDRFVSVEEFLRALTDESLATATISMTRDSAPHKRPALAGLIAALVLAGAGAGYWTFSHSGGTEQVVVVLPFENLGGDAANQALCDGLQETVASVLSSSAELKGKLMVVPSSEVRRSRVRSIAEARDRFNATLALTGTTQRGQKDLQVTLNLNDARKMSQKDSRVLLVPNDGAAGLQRQLAESLGEMLGTGRIGIASSATTASSPAYALFLQGRGALENSELDKAIAYLKKALDADPKFSLARTKLAEAYLRKSSSIKDTKYLALADEEVEKAAQTGETADVLMDRAMIRKNTGHSQEAIDLFRRVLQMDTGNVQAVQQLAETLANAGRDEEAEKTYLQGIRMRPGYWPPYESLGDFYSRRGKYAEAEHTFTTALGLASETPLLYSDLGAMYFRMGRWQDAGKAFEKSLAVRPTSMGYANLGVVRFFEGNYAEAATQSRKATELQPLNAVNWGNLGDALKQVRGKDAEAHAAYERAVSLAREQLALNPENVGLRKCYAVDLAKLGRNAEAIVEAKRALEQAPKDSAVQFWAARTYMDTGDPEAALSALERSVALGYNAREIRLEPDFAALKTHPRYLRLTSGK